MLNKLWNLVMVGKNLLLPCVKATGWAHTTAGQSKRVYNAPRTPFQRLLNLSALDDKTHARLECAHAKLNPARSPT